MSQKNMHKGIPLSNKSMYRGIPLSFKSLRKEWGGSYERNSRIARQMIDHYSDEPTRKSLDSVLGESPLALKTAYDFSHRVRAKDRELRDSEKLSDQMYQNSPQHHIDGRREFKADLKREFSQKVFDARADFIKEYKVDPDSVDRNEVAFE
jgi:hypothetical protein